MKLVSEAVDKVRRGEHKELKSIGDASLTATRFIWLTSLENLSNKQRERFADLIDSGLETGKAWAYKEMIRELWACPDEATAISYFRAWYKRVIHTNLSPLKKVARTIKTRLANVVSYCTHGITNAVAEGINSKIMAIKRRVGGYRNRENFKTPIYFYCGGLELYPQ